MITVYWSRWAEEPGEKRHAAEHRAGLELLRHGLEALHGLRVSQERLPELLVSGTRGKPCLPTRPDIQFNISHTDGAVVCAFGTGPVGVDVELPAPFGRHLPKKALTPEEQEFLERQGGGEAGRQTAFFRLWTLKESFLKCSGDGLSRALTSFSFQLPDVPGAGPVRCSEPGVYFAQGFLPDGQILAVCSAAPIRGLHVTEFDIRTAGRCPSE